VAAAADEFLRLVDAGHTPGLEALHRRCLIEATAMKSTSATRPHIETLLHPAILAVHGLSPLFKQLHTRPDLEDITDMFLEQFPNCAEVKAAKLALPLVSIDRFAADLQAAAAGELQTSVLINRCSMSFAALPAGFAGTEPLFLVVDSHVRSMGTMTIANLIRYTYQGQEPTDVGVLVIYGIVPAPGEC
jgi:hypothetical protein